jgi:cytidylate kinase
MNTIIGLGGTNGSGKDTVGHIIADEYNYLFVSVSELLRAEARKRDQPVTREVLRTISAEWRREFGLGVLVDKAVETWKASGNAYSGVVVCPMRNVGEASHLQELGGTLMWIDGDPRVRYDRIQANIATRDRAEEDNKTFEQFLAEEESEMHKPAGGDEATLDMAGVKALATTTLLNNSNELEALTLEIKKLLK